MLARSKSHRNCHFKHGRVGHPMSAFARSNYLQKQMFKDPDFKGLPLRHSGRRYWRKHSAWFPVFDDLEYITGYDSTGWKHSTKNRHQYKIKQNSFDLIS